MAKKVIFGAKPVEKCGGMELWVEIHAPLDGASNDEEVVIKLLTIYLPESQHKRVRRGCAMRDVKMADEIRHLQEEHFSW